jgi:transcriptional regulator with XRE-family HTH domain
MRARRMRLKKLSTKLKRIRVAFGYTQTEMAHALGFPHLSKQVISNFELPPDNKYNMEPSAAVLLAYARLANICPSILMDDKLSLPKQIPAATEHKVN